VEYQQTTELLNDLATINRERAKAYEDASFLNFIFNLELRGTFALLANQSRQNSFLLHQHLEQLPFNNAWAKKSMPQLTFGDLYNDWKNMSVSFSGSNTSDMLKSCEAGEDAIQAVYRKAMEQLPEGNQLLYVLENQFRGLQHSMSIIKGLLNLPAKWDVRTAKRV
jgi:hypothetical protein